MSQEEYALVNRFFDRVSERCINSSRITKAVSRAVVEETFPYYRSRIGQGPTIGREIDEMKSFWGRVTEITGVLIPDNIEHRLNTDDSSASLFVGRLFGNATEALGLDYSVIPDIPGAQPIGGAKEDIQWLEDIALVFGQFRQETFDKGILDLM